jgi:hypothetical protein
MGMMTDESLLSRYALAKRLNKLIGVSQGAVYSYARREGSPKPDDYLLIHNGGKEMLSPVWKAARLDEWRLWVRDHGQRGMRFGAHNTKCPCRPCRDRESRRCAVRQRERRAGRKFIDGTWVNPDAPHGTVRGYVSYGCLCAPCRVANRLYYYGPEAEVRTNRK